MQNINLEDYKGVYVFAQQVDNELSGIAFELLGEAGRLAKPLNTEVTAVLLGSNVGNLVDQLAEYGADKVIVVDNPELETYRTEPYAQALTAVINEFKPEIMLVGATAIGRDLGPTVSARVATGLTADCTVLEIGDFPINPIPGREQKHNQLLMTRPAFGGNTIATIACPDHRPQMATVRAGVMQKAEPKPGAKAEVINFDAKLEKNSKYVEIQEVIKSVTETVQTAENKQLQETLEKIQTQATEISDNLNSYSWIGSEDQGKISYLKQLDNGNVQLMKVLIYPSMSKDGDYQEYYYWDDELFFAYIWADSHTLSTLKDGEQRVDRYYYD